mmetsp:Transcript_61395/g.146309  ORF Transcript_61395/g.146309 Transcript_61395/m.146309 type:complete len:384 (+) Transcript_61395:740-1891(+)
MYDKNNDGKLSWLEFKKLTSDDNVHVGAFGSCADFECPDGLLLKDEASELTCEGAVCTANETGTCCAAPCSALACPAGTYVTPVKSDYVPKCSSEECEPSDAGRCCQDAPVCYQSACADGYALKDGSGNLTCKGPICSPQADQDICCEAQASCLSFACPTGYRSRTDAPAPLCAAAACSMNDTDACCEELAPCSSIAMCPTDMYIVEKAEEIFCGPTGCNASDVPRCCAKRAICEELACPDGYYNKTVEHIDEQYCEKGVCDEDADLDNCCAARDSCSNFTCPDGFEAREAEGNSSLLCMLGVCDEDDVDTCCSAVPSGPGMWWTIASVLLALVACCLLVACGAYITQVDPKKLSSAAAGTDYRPVAESDSQAQSQSSQIGSQ